MFRPSCALIALSLAACTEAPTDATTESVAQALDTSGAGIGVTDITREHVAGDVYHESFMLRLGDTPNAQIRLHRVVRERAPWLPRPTRAGVMLLHGDFSSFTTNFFESGMATWLAQHGIDVWGVDRRWAITPTDGDLSDYGSMTFAQEIDDTEVALAAARTVRLVTGTGGDRLHLSGFSRGGFLAYAVAASDGARRPAQRQVKGLVPLDVWAEVPPEDTDARAWLCEGAAFERELVAEGVTDSENSFLIELGDLTNRPLFLRVAAQTYNAFTVTPYYHLAAADIVDGVPVALTESPEASIAQWFAHATPHQSMAESADSDGLWCGDGQSGPPIDLAAIRVPLFYIGAGGGFGDHGLYSTTRVSSTDVTTTVITHAPDRFEDFGHGDMLFGYDAPTLVWQPLASWLAAH